MLGNLFGVKKDIPTLDPAKILTNKSNFEDIELVEIKFTNLKSIEDLSNVIHINKFDVMKKSKNVSDYYAYFSDFELWTTHDKRDLIIASSLSGAVFFIN